MATEAMKEIIDWAFHNDEWNEALLDIKGFQLQLVGRFSRSELDLLEEQGKASTSQHLALSKDAMISNRSSGNILK